MSFFDPLPEPAHQDEPASIDAAGLSVAAAAVELWSIPEAPSDEVTGRIVPGNGASSA
jgi:hypothetical protein